MHSSLPNLRIDPMLEEDDQNDEIGITQDICIEIEKNLGELPNRCYTESSSKRYECYSQPFVSRSLSYCSTSSSETPETNLHLVYSSPSQLSSASFKCSPSTGTSSNRTPQSSKSHSTYKTSENRTKRASKIFTFDVRTSPTINRCPSYCNCINSIWDTSDHFPWLSYFLSSFASAFPTSQQFSHCSQKHVSYPSVTVSWKFASLFLLLLSLIIILPSLLYILLHSSSSVVISQPHLSYLAPAEPSITFSLYERDDFQLGRMEMDDNWYFG